ncbi:MAG TPA: hypothetical protein VGC13_14905 [Longimicrobium sp.]|jgi:hypothetical protein|uniref:hypothetical protein n=1 Tax=Longimicrobium sp. TaxID=2029185 RepID=UPI002EDBA075
MSSLRLLVICATLATVGTSGCVASRASAGGAPEVTWTRDERLDPWRPLGVSPSVEEAERALRQTLRYGHPDECPFRLLRCGQEPPGLVLRVERLVCTQVSQYADRCSFRLTETLTDEDGRPVRTVRSRCTGTIVPLGTSHSPWEWGVSTHPDDLPMTCGRRR